MQAPVEVVANPYTVKLASGCKCSEMDASHRPRNLPANVPNRLFPCESTNFLTTAIFKQYFRG